MVGCNTQDQALTTSTTSPDIATRIIKKLVCEAMFQSLAEATAVANREQEIWCDTEDFREGVAHVLE